MTKSIEPKQQKTTASHKRTTPKPTQHKTCKPARRRKRRETSDGGSPEDKGESVGAAMRGITPPQRAFTSKRLLFGCERGGEVGDGGGRWWG